MDESMFFRQVMPLLKQKKLILAPWCETAECFPQQISTQQIFSSDPICEIFCVPISENQSGRPHVAWFWYWTLEKMTENHWIWGCSLNLQTNPSKNSQRNIHPETCRYGGSITLSGNPTWLKNPPIGEVFFSVRTSMYRESSRHVWLQEGSTMWGFSWTWGYPQMDGLFHGKSYWNGWWLGVTPILRNLHVVAIFDS